METDLQYTTLTPPRSNTGVLTPQPPDSNCITIDWLAVTFPVGTDPHDIADQLSRDPWDDRPRGAHGYRRTLAGAGIRILYDGNSDMGPHLIISGEGCRWLAQRAPSFAWPHFLHNLIHHHQVHVRRLDVAWDDVEALLDLDTIRAESIAGHYCSRSRKLTITVGYDMDELTGATVAHGSRSSETYLRIYDKALQQQQQGPWVRVELEFKGDRAHAVALRIASSPPGPEDNLAQWLTGLLRQHIEYKTPSNHSDRSRWPIAGWWERFLHGVAKCTLRILPPSLDVEKTLRWFQRCVTPTLALVLELAGGDLSALTTLAHHGRTRWRGKHLDLLHQAHLLTA